MSDSYDVESIDIPADIVDRVDKRVRYTEFEDVSDYVSYVLEEVLYHVEQENDLSGSEAVDEDQVRDRLRSLGYLNE